MTYSPDLNPIESTFKEADRKAKEKQKKAAATDLDETVTRWKEVFCGQTAMIQKCCGNWVSRCDEVIKAKGEATRF